MAKILDFNPVTGQFDLVSKPESTEDLGIVISSVPCNPAVFVGAVVRMAGGTAVNAQADNKANSNVLGICIAKPSSTLCNVRVSGVTESVLFGLDDTKEYFLSEVNPGELKTTPPTGTGNIVYRLGVPFNATRLVIDKSLRMVRS